MIPDWIDDIRNFKCHGAAVFWNLAILKTSQDRSEKKGPSVVSSEVQK